MEGQIGKISLFAPFEEKKLAPISVKKVTQAATQSQ